MSGLMEIMIAYAAIIGPALTSIFGTAFLFRKGISHVKGAADDISQHDDIKKLAASNEELRRDLRETNKTIRLLTDKIAKIEGYSDNKLGKED